MEKGCPETVSGGPETLSGEAKHVKKPVKQEIQAKNGNLAAKAGPGLGKSL